MAVDKDQVIKQVQDGLKVFRSKLDQIPALAQAEVRNMMSFGKDGNPRRRSLRQGESCCVIQTPSFTLLIRFDSSPPFVSLSRLPQKFLRNTSSSVDQLFLS